jgi:hypothetical protein
MTPQLQRFLYLGLAVARELEATLLEALMVLRPGSAFRPQAIRVIRDPYLRESLAYLEHLKDARQDELVSSTLARLESFVMDPLIRRIITAERSLDFSEVIERRQLAIINMDVFGPHRPDDLNSSCGS